MFYFKFPGVCFCQKLAQSDEIGQRYHKKIKRVTLFETQCIYMELYKIDSDCTSIASNTLKNSVGNSYLQTANKRQLHFLCNLLLHGESLK